MEVEVETMAAGIGTMGAEDRGVLVVREDQEVPVVLGGQAGQEDQEALVDQVAREVLGQGVTVLIRETLLALDMPFCGSVCTHDL